jgi:hypothetical protein
MLEKTEGTIHNWQSRDMGDLRNNTQNEDNQNKQKPPDRVVYCTCAKYRVVEYYRVCRIRDVILEWTFPLLCRCFFHITENTVIKHCFISDTVVL